MTVESSVATAPSWPVSTRTFLGRRAESEETSAGLAPGSQAALRQFSPDRLRGYGVAAVDGVELRAAVIDGAAWELAARRLAEIAEARAHAATTDATRIACLRRASALLRMSQVTMEADTEERRAIFTRAAGLFEAAAKLAQDRERVVIETPPGSLVDWLRPAIAQRSARPSCSAGSRAGRWISTAWATPWSSAASKP